MLVEFSHRFRAGRVGPDRGAGGPRGSRRVGPAGTAWQPFRRTRPERPAGRYSPNRERRGAGGPHGMRRRRAEGGRSLRRSRPACRAERRPIGSEPNGAGLRPEMRLLPRGDPRRPIRVTHPSHSSEPLIRATHPSHSSEPLIRVTHPSRSSESLIRATHPSRSYESLIRVAHPSHSSESRIRVAHPSRSSALIPPSGGTRNRRLPCTRPWRLSLIRGTRPSRSSELLGGRLSRRGMGDSSGLPSHTHTTWPWPAATTTTSGTLLRRAFGPAKGMGAWRGPCAACRVAKASPWQPEGEMAAGADAAKAGFSRFARERRDSEDGCIFWFVCGTHKQ